MAIRSKKSDDEIFETENTNGYEDIKADEETEKSEVKKPGALKRFFGSGAMRVAAFLLALITASLTLIWAFEIDRSNNYMEILPEEKYTSSGVYISNKNNLYQTLCTTATVYLRNLENGKFTGNKYLLKNFLRAIENYDISGLFTVHNVNGKPVIESDFYDYYVSFDDKGFITNMDGVTDFLTENDIENFKDSSCWYVRHDGEIQTDPKIQKNSDNYNDYYIHNDFLSYSPEFYYQDEYEEYSQYSIPLGWSGKDNYGRYIMCYGPYDNLMIYDFDTSDSSKKYIINGYIREKLTGNEAEDEDDKHYAFVTTEDGEYADLMIEDCDDYVFNALDDDGITVLMRPKQEKLALAEQQYAENANQNRILILRITICAMILAVCLIYLVIVCGYDPQMTDGKKWRYCVGFGKWHTDILILCAIGTASLAIIIALAEYDLQEVIEKLVRMKEPYSYWVVSAAASLVGAACLSFSLAVISKLKMHTFWKDFYLFKVIKNIYNRLKTVAKNSGLFKKYEKNSLSHKLAIREWIFIAATLFTVIIVAVTINRYDTYSNDYYIIYTNIHPIGIITLIAYAVYVAKFVITQFKTYKDLDVLDSQIDSICNGEEISDDIDKDSPVYENSRKLTKISDNIKETVEKQVQSERVKIELVTNVSHDLKTPLTSIISYIDLLKAEELTPEAMDYVKILEQKSEKLKNIVSDVFTLAKATSGVDVDLELIDLVILLNQALADAHDKIEKSGRQLKTVIEPHSAMILADGNKLYRVFQNLIDNALNYSMSGTRIFLTVTEENGYVRIEMKNTSSYEMTFTPDEITERFTRGDKSRTDGGNGLGLSIAKTFTEACGGVFRVELDGDVFKAIVVLQISTENRQSVAENEITDESDEKE